MLTTACSRDMTMSARDIEAGTCMEVAGTTIKSDASNVIIIRNRWWACRNDNCNDIPSFVERGPPNATLAQTLEVKVF